MAQEEKQTYFNTGLLVGVSAGLLSGLLASTWYYRNKTINPDNVLESVKKAFLEEGPIEGSWIEFSKQPVQKFAIKSKTYTGGITRLEDGQTVQYEFIADAYTGTVTDIYRL